MSVRRVALLLALALECVAQNALAEDVVTLGWDGECDQRQRVISEVNRMVGVREGPLLRADVSVRRVPRGFSVELRTDQQGDVGVRRFDAPTCDKLVDATVLILVVLLAPVDTAEAVTPVFHPAPETPKPAPRPNRVSPPEARQESRDGVHAGIGPKLGAALGVLPGIALFAGAEVWVASGAFRIGAAGQYWPERTTASDARGDGVISLRSAEVTGCIDTSRRAPHLDGCVMAAIGAYSGRGVGIPRPRESSPLFAAAGPGIVLRSEGTLSSALSLFVPVMLSRPHFQIGGIGEVFRPAVAGVALGLAVDFNLP